MKEHRTRCWQAARWAQPLWSSCTMQYAHTDPAQVQHTRNLPPPPLQRDTFTSHLLTALCR